MHITFHGATRTVTGSKHLIKLKNGKQILLDCGLFQGLGKMTETFNQQLGFEASQVTHMLLSHAHVDHTGLIPKLVKEGFAGKIFCTKGTKDLAEILLEDSGKIQTDDVIFLNKKRAKQHLPPVQPLYDLNDVANAIPHLTAVAYNAWTKIDDDIEIMFLDVCKTPELNFSMQKLYSRMIPGRSLLIHQDYIHPCLPYIKVTMGYLAEYFEYIGSTRINSAVWLLKKEIPQEILDVDPYTFGFDEVLRLHNKWNYVFNEEQKAMIMESIKRIPGFN